MNSAINILKFIFSICITFLHCGMVFGYDKFLWFHGAFVFVEWFYIFAGFTLARKIMKLGKDVIVFDTTCMIVKDRIMSFFPYYVLSCIVALVLLFNINLLQIINSWDIMKIVHNFLMLQMTTIDTNPFLRDEWFLSSLWIALVIITPLLVKFRKKFSVIAIFIAIFIYYYIYRETGKLYEPSEWVEFTYKGNLRAIAAMCLGISGYEISILLKKVLKYTIIENVIIMVIYGIIIYRYIVFWHTNEKVYFILPFVFMLLIAAQFDNSNSLIPDCKFTRFLGKISMVLYMNHAYVQHIVNEKFTSMELMDKVKYSLLFSVILTLFVYFAIYTFRILKNKIRNRN